MTNFTLEKHDKHNLNQMIEIISLENKIKWAISILYQGKKT